MLSYILYAVIAVIAIALGRAISSPGTFRIERSIRINTMPDRVAPHIADFHKWTTWSPWEQLDPSMQRTYSGAQSGKGATYDWQGNSKAGSGRMEITDVSPETVNIKLDFIRPFKANNLVEFKLKPAGTGTDVDWAMFGDRPLMIKLFGLFFNMDKVVGADFEKGLAALKQVSEQSAA